MGPSSAKKKNNNFFAHTYFDIGKNDSFWKRKTLLIYPASRLFIFHLWAIFISDNIQLYVLPEGLISAVKPFQNVFSGPPLFICASGETIIVNHLFFFFFFFCHLQPCTTLATFPKGNVASHSGLNVHKNKLAWPTQFAKRCVQPASK